MFSKTAAAKGQAAEYKRAAAVAIGCVMLKVWVICLSPLTHKRAAVYE
jgi:hypothetical protein